MILHPKAERPIGAILSVLFLGRLRDKCRRNRTPCQNGRLTHESRNPVLRRAHDETSQMGNVPQWGIWQACHARMAGHDTMAGAHGMGVVCCPWHGRHKMPMARACHEQPMARRLARKCPWHGGRELPMAWSIQKAHGKALSAPHADCPAARNLRGRIQIFEKSFPGFSKSVPSLGVTRGRPRSP